MAKTIELYSVTVLEAEGIKSTVSRRAAPWRVRGASPSIWFPHFCLCFITPVSATVIMLPLSFLSYLSLPHSFFKILLKFSSAAQLCPTLCDPHGLQHTRLPCPSPSPRACSNSCLLSQWCHPTISSIVVPSPPAFNLSQHQGLFKWVSSSHQVARILEFQLQHQSFQWIFRTGFL